MAAVPLPEASVDTAVFSLSLMGTNWLDFICEAHRVLRPGCAAHSSVPASPRALLPC